MLRFLFQCPRCAHSNPNVGALIADGKLRVSRAAWEAAPDMVNLLNRYFTGDWERLEKQDRARIPAYAEAGFCLMAAYRIGETVIHVLSNLEINVVVLAGENP